jgi:PAS domain S-box-containing protein
MSAGRQLSGGRLWHGSRDAGLVPGGADEVTESGAKATSDYLVRMAGLSDLPMGGRLRAIRAAAVVATLLAVVSVGAISVSASLCLFLSGLSVVIGLSNWARLSMVPGFLALIVAAIAAYQLAGYEFGFAVEFPFGTSLPIGDTPRIMAPNAAVGFLAFGLAQAWISFFSGNLATLVLLTGGLLTSGVGIAAGIGHMAGVDVAFQWPDAIAMPPVTAFAMWLLGAIHLAISRHPLLQLSSPLPFTIAVLAIPAGFFFDLAAPPYLGASFIYIPVILSAVWFTDRRAAFSLAIACALFAIMAYSVKLQALDTEQERLIGRLFGAGTDFIVAALVYSFKLATEQNDRVRLRFEALMDNSPDAVVTISERGLITQFNPAAERLFGHSEADVVGQNVKLLMPEPYHSEHDSYLQHLADSGERRIIGTIREVNGKRSDGSIFPLDLSISELPSDDEKEFIGVLRDLTVRKRQEGNLRATLGRLAAYAADLERSNQELDDFAYIASHDLKEPLRGIHNHSRFLLEDYEDRLDQDGKRRLDRLVHLSQRMEKLVNDLLYFSRIGRAELAVRPTDIAAVLRDVLTTLEQFLEERHAKVVVVGDLPEVICDSIRVAEVFRNLIVNAVRYNDSVERIISVGHRASYSDEVGRERKNVYFVRDNGKGIASEFHEDIFKMFKRLERADDDSGTGAGLTFVRKIVHRHGGHIWLESEPGKGTTFFFTLAPE